MCPARQCDPVWVTDEVIRAALEQWAKGDGASGPPETAAMAAELDVPPF
jgi:hypothetical protein